jgi:hypothetical protein
MKYYDFKTLRELNINNVIINIYNASEYRTNESNTTRQYLLPSGQKIAVTGSKWIDNTTNTGGIGSIDLVIYLNSLSLMKAAEILDNYSNSSIKTETSVINLINDNKPQKNTIPDSCQHTWSHVKAYLVNYRKIPEYLVNSLHDKRLLWSDNRYNCVFPRDLNSGAYLRGTRPDVPFKMTIGTNGRPYVIPGNDNKELLIITEAPIDGISLKYYYPEATIISTGGRIGFDKISPYLFNVTKVLLAQDNDKAGREQADIIMYYMPNNYLWERIFPPNDFKDWNEALKYDFS